MLDLQNALPVWTPGEGVGAVVHWLDRLRWLAALDQVGEMISVFIVGSDLQKRGLPTERNVVRGRMQALAMQTPFSSRPPARIRDQLGGHGLGFSRRRNSRHRVRVEAHPPTVSAHSRPHPSLCGDLRAAPHLPPERRRTAPAICWCD